MYTNLYSMILNHITFQNYLKIFQSSKNFLEKSCFRPIGRPAGRPDPFQAWSVDRTGRPSLVVMACTFVHVCQSTRPVDRLKALCSRVLSVDRAGRPTEQRNIFSLATGRPTGRPSPTASLPMDCRSTGPVDRQPPAGPNG